MARLRVRLVAVLLVAVGRGADAALIFNNQFEYSEGLIKTKADPDLRLSVKDGALRAGEPVVLGACVLEGLETFTVADERIRLQHNPNICLSAEDFVGQGQKIVMLPCNDGEGKALQEFVFGEDGRIRLKTKPDLCISWKPQSSLDNELMLHKCGEDDDHTRDRFRFIDNFIFSVAKPEFYFSATVGDSDLAGYVVLGKCLPRKHEVFDLAESRILIRGTGLCLHAKGGLGAGSPVIAWQCTEDAAPPAHELFAYDDARGVIYAVKAPHLAFNIAGNMVRGAEIKLAVRHWENGHQEL